MKLGVFINQEFYTDGKHHSTSLSFVRFIESFSAYFEKIIIFAPSLFVSSDLHSVYKCSDVISLCALPYYVNVSDLIKRLPSVLWKTVKKIKEDLNDCDVIWLVEPHPLGLPIYKIVKKSGIPMFLHIRGNILNDIKARYHGIYYFFAKVYANLLHRSILSMSRNVPTMVVGRELYNLFVKGSPENIFCISPSLISKNDITASSQYLTYKTDSLDRNVKILFVGRPEPEKGLVYLFEALLYLNADPNRTYYLTIIGSAQRGGAKKEIKVRKQMQQVGVEQFVKWRGYQSYDNDFLDFYRSADIFILPSLSEGIPKVLYEAMAAGVPVVTTPVGGITDIIENEKNGLLITPHSAESIVQAVQRLIEDKTLRNSLIIEGLRTAEEHTIEKARELIKENLFPIIPSIEKIQHLSILNINKFHYVRGGSETVYFGTADILEKHGHKPIFFSMKHSLNLPCATSEYFVSYIDYTERLSWKDQLIAAGRYLYSFDSARQISKLLNKYSVNIAHLHNIYHQISPPILHELKKRKIPIVMTLHDYKMVCTSYSMLSDGKVCEACRGEKYYMAIAKKCVKDSAAKSILATLEMYLHHKILDIYAHVDIFISPSLFLKNKLEEMGFEKEIVYVPNFVDIMQFKGFKGKTMDWKNEKKKSFVYFGRLSSEKGLWTLLDAAKILNNKKTTDEIEIKIIGEGPIEKELQDKVEAEGINNVRFLGYMEKEALYQEIHESIAAVLPSEWYENNPVSVLEAFSLGIPVIGGRIGGIPELVKDNETGLTFEPGNPDDLSSKFKYILNNPEKAAEMGVNARVFVEQELTTENYYKKLIKIYEKMLTRK